MCPACMVTTTLLIASAVSSGGVAAAAWNKLRAKQLTRKMLWNNKPMEEKWQQRTSK